MDGGGVSLSFVAVASAALPAISVADALSVRRITLTVVRVAALVGVPFMAEGLLFATMVMPTCNPRTASPANRIVEGIKKAKTNIVLIMHLTPAPVDRSARPPGIVPSWDINLQRFILFATRASANGKIESTDARLLWIANSDPSPVESLLFVLKVELLKSSTIQT